MYRPRGWWTLDGGSLGSARHGIHEARSLRSEGGVTQSDGSWEGTCFQSRPVSRDGAALDLDETGEDPVFTAGWMGMRKK